MSVRASRRHCQIAAFAVAMPTLGVTAAMGAAHHVLLITAAAAAGSVEWNSGDIPVAPARVPPRRLRLLDDRALLERPRACGLATAGRFSHKIEAERHLALYRRWVGQDLASDTRASADNVWRARRPG